MRNPQGSNNFGTGGAWSNTSNKWTRKMLRECHYEIKDDGIFWMSLKDFSKTFRGIEVSKVNPKFKYTSISFPSPDKKEKITTKVIKMVVTEKSHIFISVN